MTGEVWFLVLVVAAGLWWLRLRLLLRDQTATVVRKQRVGRESGGYYYHVFIELDNGEEDVLSVREKSYVTTEVGDDVPVSVRPGLFVKRSITVPRRGRKKLFAPLVVIVAGIAVLYLILNPIG